MQEYCCNMVADGGMKHDIIPCCILTCVTSVTGKIILFVKKFIQLAREGRSNNDEDTGVMENTGTDSKTMKINISFNIISHVASFPLLFGIFCRNSKQRVQTQNIFLLSYFVAQRNSIDLPLPALLASTSFLASSNNFGKNSIQVLCYWLQQKLIMSSAFHQNCSSFSKIQIILKVIMEKQWKNKNPKILPLYKSKLIIYE